MYYSKKYIKNLTAVVILICAAALILCTIIILRILHDYKKGSDVYGALKGLVTYNSSIPKIETGAKDNDSDGLSISGITAGTDFTVSVDFDALETLNTDIAAWLYCEGTDINYPVVQTWDNDYYLSRTFEKALNRCGCLFIDAANAPDFTDKNTVIYGHNMKDGSMFSTLMQYKTQAFYNSHPYMLLILKDNTYKLELFSGYVANPNDDVWKLTFADDAEFISWIETAREKSSFHSGIDIDSADTIVTLSTCTYEFDDARYIVMGRLLQAQ